MNNTEATENATEEYRAMLLMRHDNKQIIPGALVNMTEEQARPLLALGAIRPTKTPAPDQQEGAAPTLDELIAGLPQMVDESRQATAEALAAAAEAREAARAATSEGADAIAADPAPAVKPEAGSKAKTAGAAPQEAAEFGAAGRGDAPEDTKGSKAAK